MNLSYLGESKAQFMLTYEVRIGAIGDVITYYFNHNFYSCWHLNAYIFTSLITQSSTYGNFLTL